MAEYSTAIRKLVRKKAVVRNVSAASSGRTTVNRRVEVAESRGRVEHQVLERRDRLALDNSIAAVGRTETRDQERQ